MLTALQGHVKNRKK